MLLYQAVVGFTHWFGVTPKVTAEQRAILEADIRAKTGS
jgi:shikimate dehydrogenase